jgi:CRISPR-associated protein Csh1
MIEAVYKIGKIQKERDFLDEYIEDIGKNYKHVFKIIIDISNEQYSYIGIDYEEYDSNKKMKYFYKKGSSNGTDKTPTSRITEFDKTLTKKIFPVFKKIVENNKDILSAEEINFFNKLDETVNKNKEKIYEDLNKYINENNLVTGNNSIKDGGIITIVFKKNDEILYVGDLEIFRNLFKNNEKFAYKDYFYSKSNKVYSRAKNKLCYICGKNAEEVWGFVNTYNFYNVDKESYVSGGFNRELAWRNYPVCFECSKTLNRGREYIDNNLNFKFCGFNYLLVPELVIHDDNLLSNILKKLKKYTNFSLQESKSALIENVEERILRDLSEENNQINFNFVFYEKSNAAYKILLYLQEISPTRLKYLINSKDKVDKEERKYNIFEISNNQIYFSFQSIREFFSNTKKDGNFDKYFLSILNDIFIGKRININFILNRVMNKITQEYLNDNRIDILILKAYKILIYLEEINLLERGIGMTNTYYNDFEEFFRENKLFDDDVKKALFLEGVLVQKLLNIQYSERNATPFRSRLNGLKIDEKIAKRILPEVINKLEEYNKNYYKKLEETIGIYLLKSDFSKYSIDEMSFYFTLGMVLEKHFKNEELNREGE